MISFKCAICSTQLSRERTIVVSTEEMKVIAQNDFRPFQLGVVSDQIRSKAKSAGITLAKIDENWKKHVLADTIPWSLCTNCYEKTRPYAKTNPPQTQQGFFARIFGRNREKVLDFTNAGPLAQTLRRCKKCNAYVCITGSTEFILSNKAKQHEHEWVAIAEQTVIEAVYRNSELAYLKDVDGMLAKVPKILKHSRAARHVRADCLARIARLEGNIPASEIEMRYYLALHIYHKVNAHDLAAVELEKVVASAPQQMRYRNQLAIQYWLNNNWEQAEKTWNEALRLQPEDATLRADYATALMQLAEKDPANQLDYYKRVFELQPQNQQRLRNLGIVCQQTGHWAEAITYLQATLTYATEPLDSKSVADFKATVKDRIATCAVKLGRYAEAVQYWTEALAETEWLPDERNAILSDLRAAQQHVPKNLPAEPKPQVTATTENPEPKDALIAYLGALRQYDLPRAVSLISNYSLTVSGAKQEEIQRYLEKKFLDGWRLLDYQVIEARQLTDQTTLVHITGSSHVAANARQSFQEWYPLRLEEGQWRVNCNGVIDQVLLNIQPQTLNQVSVQPTSIVRYLDKLRVYLNVDSTNERIVLWGAEKEPGAKCRFTNHTVDLLVSVQIQPNSKKTFFLDFAGWFLDYPVAVELLQWMYVADALTRLHVWSYHFDLQLLKMEEKNKPTVVAPPKAQQDIQKRETVELRQSQGQVFKLTQEKLLAFIVRMKAAGYPIADNKMNEAAAMMAITGLGYDVRAHAHVLTKVMYKVKMEGNLIVVEFPPDALQE
ncbi:MAG: hypothetical protein DYG89_43310 [Caldilinea sp. CFX5]|nr:hypothetical protein [Caldilinea sp. CFX5]